MYKNAGNLYNTLLAINFSYYNNTADEGKEEMDKNHDPSNLFLKNLNMLNGTKKMKKKVNYIHKKLLLKE